MSAQVLVRLLAPALLGALALGGLPGTASATAAPAAVAASAQLPSASSDAAARKRRSQRNPTGIAAGSPRNRSGYLRLSLSNRSDGRILLTWQRPTKVKRIKRYTVTTASNLQKYNDVRVQRVHRRKQAVVVRHAATATPYSGNFTFVKLTIHRRGSGKAWTRTKWIQAPLRAGCTSAKRVPVGTFNVKGWRHENGKSDPFSWHHRRPRVLSTIISSGARAVALQEAGGAAGLGYGDERQWTDVVNGLNAAAGSSGQWRNVFEENYSRNGGYIGTRLIYDDARFQQVSRGVRGITDPSGSPIAWAPYARLRDRTSGAEFYMVSVHLEVGENRRSYDIRSRQATKVVALARELARNGKQVIVAGDFNSTVNSRPGNIVQQKLLAAGFYDAFATSSLVNSRFGTGNRYKFPVKPSPYRRDYIMSLGPAKGSCHYRNMAYTRAADVASDHFMQVATLPLG